MRLRAVLLQAILAVVVLVKVLATVTMGVVAPQSWNGWETWQQVQYANMHHHVMACVVIRQRGMQEHQ